MKLARARLILIVLLLLVQLYLRIHNPLAMAAFWDENSHIERARALAHLERSPIVDSHGKLGLYFWLGLFQLDERHGTLAAARIAIALFSLVGSAGMLAAARALFGERAMVPALAFYALAPYALFFDRMVFADPFAGALAALTAWQCIRLAQRPTRRQGVIVGLLVTLAAMAKLTTAVIAVLAPLAVLLFGDVALHGRSLGAIRAWSRAAWARYGGPLVIAGVVAVIPWLFIIGAGLWYTVGEGEQATLLDTYLIGDNTRAGGALDRLENTFIDKTGYLLSHPMAALLGGLAILLLWRRTRAALYALAWLAVIWVPITLVATELQSRYLMAGVPALAVMFGGGMVIAGDSLGGWLARTRESTARQQAGAWTGGVLALVVIAAWAVGFAIPFARTATTDPGSLDMPHRDVTNYFSGLFTTWGTHDAFLDLQARGEQLNGQVPSVGVMSSYSDQIPVVGVLRVCNVHTLVMPDGFIWACMSSHDFPDQRVPRDVSTWTTLLDTLDRWPFVYVLTDYLAPDEIPGGVPGLTWDFFGSYPRPHDGRPVTVWRVQ